MSEDAFFLGKSAIAGAPHCFGVIEVGALTRRPHLIVDLGDAFLAPEAFG